MSKEFVQRGWGASNRKVDHVAQTMGVGLTLAQGWVEIVCKSAEARLECKGVPHLRGGRGMSISEIKVSYRKEQK